MTASQGYDTGVRRALATAGLYFAGIVPAVQFAVFHTSTPAYPHPSLVWAAFGVHGIVWVCAVTRRVPAAAVLVSWTVIGVTIAVQMALAGIADPVAPRNISMTIAATAALLLSQRQALATSVAVSLMSAVALVVPAFPPPTALWSMAVQLPVYSIGVAAALGLAFRELRRVAREADTEARARRDVDRTLRRKELAADAARYRARMMHDTIVNTLGAVATARIASADSLVARRCADDARMVDVLRRSAIPLLPSVQDVFDHASELDVELAAEDVTGLQQRLAAEDPWRRREVVSTLREVVTNVAKHAGVPRARLSYDHPSSTVSISDDGVGIDDVGPLSLALTERANDARCEVEVIGAPGRGTTVRLRVAPLRDAATGLFEAASARMATVIAAVLFPVFAVVTLAILVFEANWTLAAVTPPVVMWFLSAGVVTVILKNAGRAATLPLHVVAAAYLGLAAMVLTYHLSGAAASVCGLQPSLAWAGDAAAVISAVLVLVDGRARVIVPAVLLTVVGVALTLRGTITDCGGSTLGLLATDVLVVGAFYILRRQTLRLSRAVATHQNELIARREAQERLAANEALSNDGFDTALEFSKSILVMVAESPERARDSDIRTAAGLEEGYLRALIVLTADIVSPRAKQRFVRAIDAARAARVGLSVQAEPGVLDDDSAAFVVATVCDLIARCSAGEQLSLGVFGPRTTPSLIVVVPAHALVGYPDAEEARAAPVLAETTVTAELGLVEVRWSGGAHRHS
jgi:hypothetical protein